MDQDQKTHDATERKLREAQEKGRWPASPELPAALSWFAIAACCLFLVPAMSGKLVGFARENWSLGPSGIRSGFAGSRLGEAPWILGSAAGFLLVLAVLHVMISVLQKGWVFDTSRVSPDLGRALGSGLSSVFSSELIARSLGVIIRLTVLFLIAGLTLCMAIRLTFDTWPDFNTATDFAKLFLAAGMLRVAVALPDYLFKRWLFMREMMMTPTELREEHRIQEGDPRIRERIREQANERMRLPKSETCLFTDGTSAIVVALFADAGKSPIILCQASGDGAKRLELSYRERGKAIVHTRRLSLGDSPRRMAPVPEDLHPELAETHRRLFSSRLMQQ